MGIVSGGGGGGAVAPLTLTSTDASSTPLTVTGAAAQSADPFAVYAKSGDAAPALAVDNLGGITARINNSGATALAAVDEGGNAIFAVDHYGAVVNPHDPSTTGFTVNYADGTQTVALARFAGISANVKVTAGGVLYFDAHAAPADAVLSAGDCGLWFDQTNGAAKLMAKAKTADGTVVTATIALA